jgi:hypothetical protein
MIGLLPLLSRAGRPGGGWRPNRLALGLLTAAERIVSEPSRQRSPLALAMDAHGQKP